MTVTMLLASFFSQHLCALMYQLFLLVYTSLSNLKVISFHSEAGFQGPTRSTIISHILPHA
jgi:hypothetical protein